MNRWFEARAARLFVLVALVALVAFIPYAASAQSTPFVQGLDGYEPEWTGGCCSEDTLLAPTVMAIDAGIATSADGDPDSGNPAIEAPTDPSESAVETTSRPTGAVIAASEGPGGNVEWKTLMYHSLFFLGVMNSFRITTEPSTRDGLHNSVFGGYFKALGAMHGWSDGDGYYENYLGHPIQGAVSGFLWLIHDPKYRNTEFGTSRDYWMGKLRATGFAWAFSEQFEIGLVSEASIGQIQRYCCAWGFVDHIITPAGGLFWMVGTDVIDKYVTRRIEDHTHNTAVRIIARVGLNPPQGFANLMAFQVPWRRENRPGVRAYDGQLYLRPVQPAGTVDRQQVPRFELTMQLPSTLRYGGQSCLGGGAVGGYRLDESFQWTMEVSGCTLRGLSQNWSGDSLTFTTGPQWNLRTKSRWSPHAHVRMGIQKVTQEYVDPELKKITIANLPPGKKPRYAYDEFARNYETTGFSVSVGGGLDVTLSRAVAMRLMNFDYAPSWLGRLNGAYYNQGVRLSTGFILRFGTW